MQRLQLVEYADAALNFLIVQDGQTLLHMGNDAGVFFLCPLLPGRGQSPLGFAAGPLTPPGVSRSPFAPGRRKSRAIRAEDTPIARQSSPGAHPVGVEKRKCSARDSPCARIGTMEVGF